MKKWKPNTVGFSGGFPPDNIDGPYGTHLFWSTELTYYSQRVHGISAFKRRPKQAMGLRFKSFVNKINPLLYHEFVYSDPRKYNKTK